MKKIISVMILGLMLYNIMGYYVVYLGMVLQAKSEMKEKIEGTDFENELTTLVFNFENGSIAEKDFRFENEDEFEYKGQMYDIVKCDLKNGYAYFYCINDLNEESVQSALDKHISDHFSTDQAAQKRVNTFTKNIVKKGIKNNSTIQVTRINNNCLFFNFEIDYLVSFTREIKTPPPKFS